MMTTQSSFAPSGALKTLDDTGLTMHLGCGISPVLCFLFKRPSHSDSCIRGGNSGGGELNAKDVYPYIQSLSKTWKSMSLRRTMTNCVKKKPRGEKVRRRATNGALEHDGHGPEAMSTPLQ